MKTLAAPKYQTAYACEGKKLTIECDPGDLISLIRANYGRFSITICNDHGNVEWSVNCMFPKSLTVLNSRCAHKQSCTVPATTAMFGDPCPGTHKYLEAHYQCVSASQTSTTTNRPSPPWVLTNSPPILANGSTVVSQGAAAGPAAPPQQQQQTPRLPTPAVGTGIIPGAGGPGVPGIWNPLPSSPGPPIQPLVPALPSGRLKGNSQNATAPKYNRHDGLPPPPPLHHHHHTSHFNNAVAGPESSKATNIPTSNGTGSSNTRILTGVGGTGNDDSTLLTTSNGQKQLSTTTTTAATTAAVNLGAAAVGGTIRTINNLNTGVVNNDDEEANMFCGPTNARNLFWNVTRVGDVNVQPCPGGATGIAKWRCVLVKRLVDSNSEEEDNEPTITLTKSSNITNCTSINCEVPTVLANQVQKRFRNFEPSWHPVTPDLTQCRSLWLNSLEVRVNQRDSSLISISNDLSEVTSSKTLYGGDMLVTTKIIQTMSEKMFHDKETFPDQRQREAIILELLLGVVKTGSNLLDESQLPSWLDLNQEDQMRVATSLLTGLEYNAFLLADTIIRERNVVQKVKNILLSVRVLETKNIQNSVVFPEAEQWQISDDRIELPRAALMENSEGGLVRIVFAAFDRLESILKPSYDQYDLKNARTYVRSTAMLRTNESEAAGKGSQQQQQQQQQQQAQQQRIRILNSKVISASLGKGRHIQLSQPIKLVLRHIKTENVTNPTCVFWNYIDHAWSANGCNLESTNRTHSVCMCNHLTNFALLMDVVDEHSQSLFTMFDGNMRIFIYISVSICVLFIVIAILTLKIFNGVFTKSARNTIYRNIYICLLLIEILFLIGIELSESNILCGFTTIFLHCAILSVIAWFCYEALQSYSILTTDDLLIENDQTAKINCYYLFSYALSISIVAISLVVNPSTYTQNDFCVLMDKNYVFYSAFVIPITAFFMGAICYTLLSWSLMRRKSRTALKNKEHTRLANVRFDVRCSFIFLLILCAVLLSAYFYLRLSKINDTDNYEEDHKLATIFGYLFIGFNTLMSLYIFVFHCIQNEKIRREYRKYVRQNSWLPKCLRCSKASISSGIVGTGGSGTGVVIGAVVGGAGGTISSNTINSTSTSGTQLKKSKMHITDDGNNDNDDEITATITGGEQDDVIVATSDCELNESQIAMRRNGGYSGGSGSTLKSGVLQGKANILLEQRSLGVTTPPPNNGTGTLRSIGRNGMHTPSAGHTSPTSSAGSTHLIFGQGHKPKSVGAGLQEAYYHQPDYQSWRQQGPPGNNGRMPVNTGSFYQRGGDFSLAMPANSNSPQKTHEYFYWTQSHNQHGKKKRGNAGAPQMVAGGNNGNDSPGGSLQSRVAAASQILFYPSYRKTTMKNQQQQQHVPPHQQQQYQQQQYSHYAEAIEPGGGGSGTYYQQQHRRYPSTSPLQQQYLSSDEELSEATAAQARLLHLSRRAGGNGLQSQQLPPLPYNQYGPPGDFVGGPGLEGQQQQQQPHRFYRNNKHSNCDLNQEFDRDPFYNQGSLSGDGGPVYEEILSNRNSDVQHYDVDGPEYYDDDEDENFHQQHYQQQQPQQRLNGVSPQYTKGRNTMAAQLKNDSNISNNSNNSRRHKYKDSNSGSSARNGINGRQHYDVDDDNDEEDDADGDESGCGEDDDIDDMENSDGGNAAAISAMMQNVQGDERVRRLMAMQDEDFQRRFQRQQRKNLANNMNSASDYDGVQQQQTPQKNNSNNSMRNFQKASNRPVLNELLNHGPPLPPANQHSMQQGRRQQQQQQQQQQLSPKSNNSSASSPASATTSPGQQILQQQQPQPIGRTISAMLDENNTVRCYLEPLAK